MNPDLSINDDRTENEISEDSLRLALERLGKTNKKRPAQTRQMKSAQDTRRRRFVQEGQVVVEHHQTSRSTQRGNAGSRAASGASDEHMDDINRFRHLLKLEQRRAEDAQRELSDAQVQLRTLETHLVHEKLHVKELKARCSEVEKALMEAQLTVDRLREKLASSRSASTASTSGGEVVVKKGNGPGRPPKVKEPVDTANEPEPVRWWKD